MTDAELAGMVTGAVALVLGFPVAPTPPTRVTDAAAAAVAVARRYVFGSDALAQFPPPAQGPDIFAGLTALAVRIYHDPASPGGVVGGDAYTGAAIPEDLLAHVRHYLDPYRTIWGLA
ncbi:MAG TPA: hypothetical protein VJM49_13580 [Acidimicrobiales bacterium]|nr:hypothetical protein [Acidimicrobiales bacterium]